MSKIIKCSCGNDLFRVIVKKEGLYQTETVSCASCNKVLAETILDVQD